ncbi:MAG: S24/S26 family peptidase [Paludibacteraceae bacterium]|nr:S24/S26 family peptidase [Paludibacteraceae bacterium]
MNRQLVPNDILLESVRELLLEGHTVILRVAGYSMRPLLENRRDSVILKSTKDCQLHDVVLAEITPGHFVLHRVIAVDGEYLTLMGDCNLVGQEHCQRKDVLGVVTFFLRKDRKIDAKAKWMPAYIYIWLHLLPIRKGLLLIYRAKLKLTKVLSFNK